MNSKSYIFLLFIGLLCCTLQGCKSRVVMLGYPTYLLSPFEIPPYNKYDGYVYQPLITKTDRELSHDSVYSKYVRFQDGWFTLRFTEEVKLYEMLLLNLDEKMATEMERNTAIKCISMGYYTEYPNRIILKDPDNGMRIKLKKISKDTLQTDNRLFPFLKGKKLSYGVVSFNAEKYFAKEMPVISESSITEVSDVGCSDTKICEKGIPMEIFISENEDLFLRLDKDSSYRYYVCGLLLSEGTWEQKGKRLELHDKHLKHTFYGKITNQGILSGYWPGDDMEGTLLKRIEE